MKRKFAIAPAGMRGNAGWRRTIGSTASPRPGAAARRAYPARQNPFPMPHHRASLTGGRSRKRTITMGLATVLPQRSGSGMRSVTIWRDRPAAAEMPPTSPPGWASTAAAGRSPVQRRAALGVQTAPTPVSSVCLAAVMATSAVWPGMCVGWGDQAASGASSMSNQVARLGLGRHGTRNRSWTLVRHGSWTSGPGGSTVSTNANRGGFPIEICLASQFLNAVIAC